VITSPFAETNEPLPPELNRTLAFCRCSSHWGVGSNWYFSFSRFSGGALKSHIPSSANADAAKLVAHAMAKTGNFGREIKLMSIAQHRMLLYVRQLLSQHSGLKPEL
jgi:hypothetical protein